MIKTIHEYDVKNIVFQPLYPETLLSKKLELSKEDREEFSVKVKEGLKLAKQLEITTNLEDFLFGNKFEATSSSPPCFLPWYYMCIQVNGKATPCPVPLISENAREKTLSEIWFGKKFNKFRKYLMEGKKPSDRCERCCGATMFETKKIKEMLNSFGTIFK